MSIPNYINNTDTPTEYGEPIANPTDSISMGALYAFKEDPHIVLAQANEERKKYKQTTKEMANDLDNYIPIRSTDAYNIEGAVGEFKRREQQAKTTKFLNQQTDRMTARNTAIEKSVAAASRKTETLPLSGGRKTRRRHKKSRKTMRKHRKHRRKTNRRR
jgi:hypothetical protein